MPERTSQSVRILRLEPRPASLQGASSHFTKSDRNLKAGDYNQNDRQKARPGALIGKAIGARVSAAPFR
jgi:hypothetical protein